MEWAINIAFGVPNREKGTVKIKNVETDWSILLENRG